MVVILRLLAEFIANLFNWKPSQARSRGPKPSGSPRLLLPSLHAPGSMRLEWWFTQLVPCYASGRRNSFFEFALSRQAEFLL